MLATGISNDGNLVWLLLTAGDAVEGRTPSPHVDGP